MLFSTLTQSFYSEDLEYPNLPEDIFEITSEQWLEALDKINSGFYVYVKKERLVASKHIRPSLLHTFDVATEKWTQTKEQKTILSAHDNAKKLALAQKEYDKVSKEILEYNYILEDEDFNIYTKEQIIEFKMLATKYRVALRAYLNTDGAEDLPVLDNPKN